jgi:subtilisin family serine protease
VKNLIKRMEAFAIIAILAALTAPIQIASAASMNASYAAAVERLVKNNWDDGFFSQMTLQVGSSTLVVDGEEREIDPGRGTTPVIHKDRTLLPIRSIVEAIGGEVEWDSSSQKVILQDDETKVELAIGSSTIVVNGRKEAIDAPPAIINGRTMVPVRAAAESMGLEVEWVAQTQSTVLTRNFQTKRLVAKLKSGSYDFSKYNAQVVESAGYPTVIQFETIAEAKQCQEELEQSGRFEYVEPDMLVLGSGAAGDASLSWGTERIGARAFAEMLKNQGHTPYVNVAVLDSGIDLSHPFLSGRINRNGMHDFINGDDDPTDDFGHGTHVSGTIIDCTPQMNIQVLPIKVLDGNNQGTWLGVSLGIEHVLALGGVDVINLSLSGGKSDTIDQVVRKAHNAGITVVVSAGNASFDVAYFSPANIQEIIAVSSVNQNDHLSEFSNYGASIDFAAPGESIKSSILGGVYGNMDGTSMAAPHVAAAAALVLSEDPGRTPAQVQQRLKSLVDDRGSAGWDSSYGFGIINLNLGISQKPTITPTPSISPTSKPSPSKTPTPTPTKTPSPTASPTPKETPTATPKSTPTATPKSTPTATPKSTPTATPKSTPSATPAPIPTATPVPGKSVVEYRWDSSSISLSLPHYPEGQLRLYAIYNDGSRVDATKTSSIEIDDESIAAWDPNGLVQAISPGETYAWLESPGLSSVKVPGIVRITVTEDKIVSLAWSEKSLTLKVGEAKPFAVNGVFQSGAVRDVTSLVEFSTDSPDIAEAYLVDGVGMVKGISVGSALMSIRRIPYDNLRLPAPMSIKVTK